MRGVYILHIFPEYIHYLQNHNLQGFHPDKDLIE